MNRRFGMVRPAGRTQPQRAGRGEGLGRRDILRLAAVHRLVALARGAVVPAFRQMSGSNSGGGSGGTETATAKTVRRFGAGGRPGQLSALPALS